MKSYSDTIKMANAMQKEREIKAQIARESPETDVNRFEQSFIDVFLGDETFERAPKHKTAVEIHSYHGVSIHDF